MIRRIVKSKDYYSLKDIEKLEKSGYYNFLELYDFFNATQFNLVSDIEHTREKVGKMKKHFQMNWIKLFGKLKNEVV